MDEVGQALDILGVVREITVTGLLALQVIALLKGWVVTRFHYDEMMRQQEARVVRAANRPREY